MENELLLLDYVRFPGHTETAFLLSELSL